MKKADIGVEFHLVGCDDRDQYFYRVNYTV